MGYGTWYVMFVIPLLIIRQEEFVASMDFIIIMEFVNKFWSTIANNLWIHWHVIPAMIIITSTNIWENLLFLTNAVEKVLIGIQNYQNVQATSTLNLTTKIVWFITVIRDLIVSNVRVVTTFLMLKTMPLDTVVLWVKDMNTVSIMDIRVCLLLLQIVEKWLVLTQI